MSAGDKINSTGEPLMNIVSLFLTIPNKLSIVTSFPIIEM